MKDPSDTTRTDKDSPNSYSELDDNRILTLIKNQRDRMALTELYNRYRCSLGRYLQRGIGDSKLIEEAYNDVMMTVWNSAGNFHGKSKVSTWLYGIARNKRMTHYQRESKHAHHTTEDQLDSLSEKDDSSLKETIQNAITALSDQHKDVIELAYFHGYSTAEIAEIVDCPANTVKTRLFHARQKLKVVLQPDFNVGAD